MVGMVSKRQCWWWSLLKHLPPGPVPTHVVESRLSVNPTSFNGNTDCSYAQGNGWFCVASLANSRGERNLNWSASSSGLPGITFYPASGTLLPRQTVQVNAF